jgi:GNAT superfamily N-acetyltransferase
MEATSAPDAQGSFLGNGLGMEVRKARLAEVRRVARLWEKLMLFHQELDPEYYALRRNARRAWMRFARKIVRSKSGMLLVALDDNKIVGYALGFLKRASLVLKLQRVGFVSDAFVEEAYRRKGIARKLFKALMDWFERKGLEWVELQVDSRNEVGVRVWERLGLDEVRKVMRLRLKHD